MSDIPVRTLDLNGVVALATVLQGVWKDPQCPGNCGCNPVCGCNDNDGCCENRCECEKKEGLIDIYDVLSNPVFRDVVQGLDLNRIKSVHDFQAIVGEIRTKMRSSRLTSSS
ncbi:MAG: hypothetical protein MRK02_03180 [Candidatus Scalindua sp.]|nr:hypothetical protein [Candidatus Scalindua sp.]